MEETLYTRIRGQISGPFDEDQLRSLVKRGMLARMHELSPDKRQWVRADAYGELFCVATPAVGYALPAEEIDETPTQPDAAATYFYREHGESRGPVSADYLQALIDSQRLVGHDQVRPSHSPQWQPLSSLGAFELNQFAVKSAAAERHRPQFSALAIASFVASLLWLCGLGSIAAIVLGLVAFSQISAARGRLTGQPLALAGVCLGAIGLTIAALGWVMVFTEGW